MKENKPQVIPEKCIHGHPMTPENQYKEMHHFGHQRPRIRCLQCLKNSSKKAKEKAKGNITPTLRVGFSEWSKERLCGAS